MELDSQQTLTPCQTNKHMGLLGPGDLGSHLSDNPHATARRHTVGPGDSKHTQVCYISNLYTS